MQASTVESLPFPELSRHLQAMIWAFHATPVIPFPLLPTAPITPANHVPWPKSSLGSLVPVKALNPCPPSTGFTHMLSARSSCVARTPESSSAITTLPASVKTSHACGALISAPGVPPFCPVLFSHHNEPS